MKTIFKTNTYTYDNPADYNKVLIQIYCNIVQKKKKKNCGLSTSTTTVKKKNNSS